MEAAGIILTGLTGLAVVWAVINICCWPRVKVLRHHLRPTGRFGQHTIGAHGAIIAPVSVLIPARDEERNLPAVLDSLMQQGAEVVEILVLDDQSSDGTAEVVQEYTRRDPRIRLISGRRRPAGWFGKTWAGKQLADEACSRWMLFLDADVVLAPGAVNAILDAAAEHDATYVSCWPRFEMASFWEFVGVPMLNFATLTTFLWPLSFRRPKDDRMIVASGACMLMHRRAYEAVGGHQCCAYGLLEDHAFARAWRRCGERSVTLDGQDVVSVRMYRSREEVVRGFQKNAAKVFRGPGILWAFIAIQIIAFVSPFLLAPLSLLTTYPADGTLLWIAMGNVLLARTLLSMAYRMPAWIALLHPLGIIGMLWVVLLSWYSITSGRGVTWKGRTYFTRPAVDRAGSSAASSAKYVPGAAQR